MNEKQITGLVLCGGQASRMAGVDKGLQIFRGQPLGQRALARLATQVGPVAINANRHLGLYARWGAPVWPDTLPGYAGPLAGFLAGLQQCSTTWLLTVPCDTPFFPLNLASRLLAAAEASGRDIAWPCAPEMDEQGVLQLHDQPAFCLLRCALKEDLQDFLAQGGRAIHRWAMRHAPCRVNFEPAASASFDEHHAFDNANTFAQLRALESPR